MTFGIELVVLDREPSPGWTGIGVRLVSLVGDLFCPEWSSPMLKGAPTIGISPEVGVLIGRSSAWLWYGGESLDRSKSCVDGES